MIAELTSGPGLGLARRRVLTFLPAPRDATLPSGEAAPLRPARAPPGVWVPRTLKQGDVRPGSYFGSVVHPDPRGAAEMTVCCLRVLGDRHTQD